MVYDQIPADDDFIADKKTAGNNLYMLTEPKDDEGLQTIYNYKGGYFEELFTFRFDQYKYGLTVIGPVAIGTITKTIWAGGYVSRYKDGESWYEPVFGKYDGSVFNTIPVAAGWAAVF